MIVFRGREIVHPETGQAMLDSVVKSVSDIAMVEQRPMMEGRRMVMIIGPRGGVIRPASPVTGSGSGPGPQPPPDRPEHAAGKCPAGQPGPGRRSTHSRSSRQARRRRADRRDRPGRREQGLILLIRQ